MLSILIQKIKQKGFIGALRFCLTLPTIVMRYFRRKKIYGLQDLEERFSYIYHNKHWQSGQSLSGEGSEISYTENLRKQLAYIIKDYNILSIVDAPCGDYHWMKELRKKSDFTYAGFDIVEELIIKNISQFSNKNT